jgi:hypothetical protein
MVTVHVEGKSGAAKRMGRSPFVGMVAVPPATGERIAKATSGTTTSTVVAAPRSSVYVI